MEEAASTAIATIIELQEAVAKEKISPSVCHWGSIWPQQVVNAHLELVFGGLDKVELIQFFWQKCGKRDTSHAHVFFPWF